MTTATVTETRLSDTLDLNELRARYSKVAGVGTYPTTRFADVLAQVTAEEAKKFDTPAKRGDLFLSDDLTLDGTPLTKHALGQVASFAKVPSSVVSLADLADGAYRDKVAEIINRELERNVDSHEPCLLRKRKADDGSESVRAVLKGKPVIFDAVDVLELFSDRLKGKIEGAIAPRVHSDLDTYRINFFLPDDVVEGRDSKIGKGFQVAVSEVGGSTQVKAYTFDHACLNGQVGIHESVRLKVYKDGDWVDRTKTGDELARGMELLLSASDNLLKKLGYTYDVPVPEPAKAIAYLVNEFGLSEEEGKAWVTGYIEEKTILRRPSTSAYTVINGLNHGAQFMESDKSRETMETLVTRLVSPKPDTTEEEIATNWQRINKKASKLEEKDYIQYLWLMRN